MKPKIINISALKLNKNLINLLKQGLKICHIPKNPTKTETTKKNKQYSRSERGPQRI